MSSLVDLLSRQPGSQTAIVIAGSGARVSYRELADHVAHVAAQLSAAGITKGDRVALALPNGLPALVSLLAVASVATAAPINPASREAELRFHLDDTSARALIVPAGGGEAVGAAAASTRVIEIEVGDSQVRLRGLDAPRPGSPIACAADDVALVLHTSGSTGRPKRVPLSHTNLATSAANVARSYGLTPADVALCVMPLFHVHGLVASALATLASGGTVVLVERFNPMGFWRVVREHRASWMSAVPTILSLALARFDARHPLPDLRFVRACSAPLAPALMAALEAALAVPVVEAYGMTEAAHQMTSNALPPGRRKAGSVGVGTGVDVSIMDPRGRHLSAGERGEVVVRGANVTRGYEDRPEENAVSFVEGWFRTGDEGIVGDDGYLSLVGRIKEMINRGGEKIAPREVDDVLASHPAVAEAVTFGLPHPVWGEEIAAAVVLRGDASESQLIAHCRERLADFKCPKRVIVTDALPKTPSGKLQRRRVAAAFASTHAFTS